MSVFIDFLLPFANICLLHTAQQTSAAISWPIKFRFYPLKFSVSGRKPESSVLKKMIS